MVGAAVGELSKVDFPAVAGGRGGQDGAEVTDVERRGGDRDGEGGAAQEGPCEGDERDEVAVSHEREHHYVAIGVGTRTHFPTVGFGEHRCLSYK